LTTLSIVKLLRGNFPTFDNLFICSKISFGFKWEKSFDRSSKIEEFDDDEWDWIWIDEDDDDDDDDDELDWIWLEDEEVWVTKFKTASFKLWFACSLSAIKLLLTFLAFLAFNWFSFSFDCLPRKVEVSMLGDAARFWAPLRELLVTFSVVSLIILFSKEK
jgi:hypothetical protein